MTDQELLQLAAKAAGLNYSPEYGCVFNDEYPQGIDWNPLQDDGDALRLAAAIKPLRIEITHNWASVEKSRWVTDELTSGSEQKHGDPMLYIRRAIVRAAAELGKAMTCSGTP